MLKLRVANDKLNTELQFSEKFAEPNLIKTFERVELLHCMLLKPLAVTEN